MKINNLNINSDIEILFVETNNLLVNDSILDSNEKIKIAEYKNEKRKTQFIVERLIAQNFLGKDYKGLFYNADGKPFLRDTNFHISISHTSELVAMAFSRQNIGLDLEIPRESLLKVKNRFLSSSDLDKTTPNSLEKLSFLWNLKEAALKYFGDPKIDFKKCIQITSCDYNESAFVEVLYNTNLHGLKSSLKKINEHTLAVVYNDYNC